MVSLFRLSRTKILFVDDHSDIRKLLVLRFQESGSDIVEAATGVEALGQAHTTCPNLIVTDVAMPGGNGRGWRPVRTVLF